MAICAAHFAFRHLRLQRPKPSALADQHADFFVLHPSNMIEFHDDRIEKPAVNTRMSAQVGQDVRSIPLPISCNAHSSARVVAIAITMVICSAITAPTLNADGMAPPCFRVSNGIGCFVVRDAASSAWFHASHLIHQACQQYVTLDAQPLPLHLAKQPLCVICEPGLGCARSPWNGMT
jgi:hypothetical protein